MHPILFEIPTPWGGLPIFSYGMMLGFSFIVAWYFVMYFGQKIESLDPDWMANSFIIIAISALAGARILYIMTNPDQFDSMVHVFQFRRGGLVAYGGFIGGFAAAWAYCRVKGMSLLPWADIIAPTLGTGLLFTRIGCWLYGCDFGRPLEEDAPGWLANLGTFPKWDFSERDFLWDASLNGSPAYTHHRQVYSDAMHGLDHSLPVHPTQLYESLAGLLIFGLGFYVLTHRKFRGQVFFTLTIAYAVWRFLIEFVRDDPERGAAFGFSTSQLVSMLIVPLTIFAWIHTRKRVAEVGEPPIPDSVRSEEWLEEHRGKTSGGGAEDGSESKPKRGGGKPKKAGSEKAKRKKK